jgi:predicted flap endonuclease-1-like 5' DNA nuclease
MTSIIILILLILAAFFLGWLISRLLFNGDTIDNSGLTAQIVAREAELEACKKNNVALSASLAAKSIAPVSVEEATPMITNALAPSIAIDIRVDDLKIVEGIGPKIEELLNNAAIKTFAGLAGTSVNRLKEILEAAGPRYQMHNPGTWPNQAALARDNKWNELKLLQDELNKGKVE